MFRLATILFGAAFTLAAAYSLGSVLPRRPELPRVIRFAIGAALLSLLIFLLLAVHFAKAFSFLVLGLLAIGGALIVRRRRPAANDPEEASWPGWLPAAVFAVFGAFYFVHALAPEIQPDAAGYHLGLAREFLRVRGFPVRIAFHEVLPHGMETLFAMAFAFGKHSAAKLVHFGFLAATLPLMLLIGKQLGLPRPTSVMAAGFYLVSPVVGVSGTSAYTDAALVFFFLAAFSALWSWKERGDDRLALAAGILAGFCYGVKMTGLLAPALGLAFVVARRRWKAATLFAAGAALMVAPWMLRNYWWTGNPLAPLFNDLFPNPHFLVPSEQRLTQMLRTYKGLSQASAPLELALRGELLQGLTGPLFLLAPLGLLALRRRAGWIAAAMAALLAIPWFLNMGTRFLMPSLPWIAMLLAMALPRRAAPACLALHALASLPPLLSLYAGEHAWRLRGLPLRAALRIEPEREYLRRTLWGYRLAEAVESKIKPGARVLDFVGLPRAYFAPEVVGTWQSAEGERLAEALATAASFERGALADLRARWSERPLSAVRVQWAAGEAETWNVYEITLYRGEERVRNQPDWVMEAVPNIWEAFLAKDGNYVSRWSSREAARAGMYIQIEFPGPVPLSGASATLEARAAEASIEFLGRIPDGGWTLLSRTPDTSLRPALNLRPAAINLLRRRGIDYILARGGVAQSMQEAPGNWGVCPLASFGEVSLFIVP